MTDKIYAVFRDGKALRGRAYLKKGYATLSQKANYNTEVRTGQVVWDGEGGVVLSHKEYQGLLDRDNELYLLEAHGVDNWEGYSDALNDTEGYGGENGDK